MTIQRAVRLAAKHQLFLHFAPQEIAIPQGVGAGCYAPIEYSATTYTSDVEQRTGDVLVSLVRDALGLTD